MTPEGHRTKAERIERSLPNCSPEYYEMVIEGAMLAVSHWINYVFHILRLTPHEKDVMHAYHETVFTHQYFGLVAGPEFLDGLEAIETLRALHVRGNVEGGERAATRALEILGGVRQKALASGAGTSRRPPE